MTKRGGQGRDAGTLARLLGWLVSTPRRLLLATVGSVFVAEALVMLLLGPLLDLTPLWWSLVDATAVSLIMLPAIRLLWSRPMERQRAAEVRSRERFAGLADATDAAIVGVDQDARIALVNLTAEETYGYATRELVGKPLTHLIPEPLRDKHLEGFFRFTRSDRRYYRLTREVRGLRKDGTEFPMELSVARTGRGEDALFFAIARDVTARHLLEGRLRKAEKLEAIGELAGGIAHDFGNLMLAARIHTEFVLEALPGEDEQRSDLGNVLEAIDRATALTKQLLAFSRRQVLEPRYVDVGDILAGLRPMLEPTLGTHITLEVIAGKGLGTVHVDPGQLERVLMNLCINARDAMADGGQLTIETENVLINGSFVESHTWADPGRYVLLSVTDTGAGMEPCTLDRIFEPFFTTKETGTGLGLSTVYGIVNQHGGLVHAYSEPGRGTTFKVYLPVAEQPASVIGTKIAGRVVGGTETILLAEDDASVRSATTRILEQAGYTVLGAASGAEARRLFDAHASEIHLALLDVVMPDGGGQTVQGHIATLQSETPTLFMTAYSPNSVHTGFVLEGATRLLQKPFDREQLLRRVRAVLDEPDPDRE